MDGTETMPDVFFDRSGRPIRFTYEIDCEPPNRGFVEDAVVAWHGDCKVGYIRAEYFTRESFAAHHPTIFNFAAHIRGSAVLPYGRESEDPRNGDPAILSHVCRHMADRRLVDMPDEVPATYDLLLALLRGDARAARAMSSLEEGMEKEIRWRIDFPMVSYVCTRTNANRGLEGDESGLGIGTELYRRMGLALAGRGLELRSSTLRSKEADRAWIRMERMGWAVVDGDRFRLVASALAAEAAPPDEGPKAF